MNYYKFIIKLDLDHLDYMNEIRYLNQFWPFKPPNGEDANFPSAWKA